MYTRQEIAPLTINTRSNTDGKQVFTAAAFRYTEEPSALAIRRATVLKQAEDKETVASKLSLQKQTSPQTLNMNAYSGSTTSPPGMFVRALYDYDADDRTSLSFRQGDVIQVLNQLESGWWDGIINDVRGWFPSNYCAVVNRPEDSGKAGQNAGGAEDSLGESGTESEYEEYEEEISTNVRDDVTRPTTGTAETQEQEEAAFWIPQATPDGRLFYFNTLTGVSTMELPLETPTSVNETGPRDRMNIRVPDQTKPPPEMMARGFERDEEDEATSASEAEGESLVLASRGSLQQRRRSYISDGASPAASMESLNVSPAQRNRNDSQDYYRSDMHPHQATTSLFAVGAGATSFTSNLLGQGAPAAMPRSFYDDGISPPVTWNRLVENMRKSVESYRRAINNADRSEYVRKAEDISDHLRMLLAAGSRTTDNHSGNPSIISTNKALYPHFRDMMSRFSKLVLSSHIAAADWPAPDSYTKCLQEAEGVLHGVYGYVEVARAQRGEDISRLAPGFILGNHNGGSWQNNNIGSPDPMSSTSFMDQDDFEPFAEPSAKLDPNFMERMDDLRLMIESSIRRLDEHLVVAEKTITPLRHEQISNSICAATGKVLDFFRPWISTVESVNLAPLDSTFQGNQLADLATQKQRLYDLIADLLIACQAIAGPMSDEWAGTRGEPLENRLNEVRNITKQLEASISQVGFSLQLLLENISGDITSPQMKDMQSRSEVHRRTDSDAAYQTSHYQDISHPLQRARLTEKGQSVLYSEGIDSAAGNYRRDNSKVKKFFGEVPAPIMPKRESEETPSFLKLDHEGEISYDTKVNPPQLRGGTLTALVEQLTRHDRLDSPFNESFLLTYRSFTTASELFEMLVRRFTIQPPRGISDEDYRTWVEQKQKLIRFRVVNILKSWFDHFWMENNDEKSNQLLRRVYSFAKDSIATTTTPGSKPLMTVIEQRLRGQDTNAKRLVPTMNNSAPIPIMPKNMKKLKFLDIDVTEFARQLTIIESRLYGKIKPTECLNKTWQKKLSPDEPEPAPHVKALILHSNQLTNWVAEMILTQSDVKKRVVVIKHFVSVADVGLGPYPDYQTRLTRLEMSNIEQLLYAYINHLRPRDCTYRSATSNMGSSQHSNIFGSRTNAKINGKYEELWRVPRKSAPRKPPMHPFLW